MKRVAMGWIAAFLVSWKVIGAGERVCDRDIYTNAEKFCETHDLDMEKWFETKAGAKEFVEKAPSKGIHNMKTEEKEKPWGSIRGIPGYGGFYHE